MRAFCQSVCLLVVVVLCAAVSWAQGGLRFNEISPLENGGQAPWLEIVNHSPGPEPTTGLVLATGPNPLVFYQPPVPSPPLAAGAMAVVIFDAPSDSTPVSVGIHRWLRVGSEAGWVDPTAPWSPGDPPLGHPPGSDVPEVHLPAELAQPWSAHGGWVALLDGPPAPGAAFPNVLDMLVFGSRAETRGVVGPHGGRPTFKKIPLSSGFGVSDPGASLTPGATVGLYPGGDPRAVEDWVLFDSEEATKGGANAVPRSKIFTLANGAVIGTQSFAVGWRGHRLDEAYHVRIATDSNLDNLVFDSTDPPDPIVSSSFRMATVLHTGRYWYRVAVAAEPKPLNWSRPRFVDLVATSCDWPMPVPATVDTLQNWLNNPNCSLLADCALIDEMDFKFQRKDTHLLCKQCPSGAAGGPCSWDHPHPFSHDVHFSSAPSRPHFVLSAGNVISKACGADLVSLAEPQSTSSVASCDHGSEYCVMASISMIASAYGACLSQDRVAAELAIAVGTPRLLRHAATTASTSTAGPPGGFCSALLKWALGTDGVFYYSVPFSSGSSGAFQTVRLVIDLGRPVMTETLSKDHMRVLAGYCVDPAGEKWVYLFDPATGPRAEAFSTWHASSGQTWVAPSADPNTWNPSWWWPPDDVLSDEYSVWNDWDGDGLMNFDEVERFGMSPFNTDSDGDGIGDQQELPP